MGKRNPFFCNSQKLFSILSIYFSIFTISCNNFKNSGMSNQIVDFIDLGNEPMTTGFYVSDKIKEFHFVNLEHTENSIIGEINKIIQQAGRIYVLDRFVSSRVFVFDSTGKFLFNIGSVGKGRGQYIYPHDMLIDSADNTLLILDSENKRINRYSSLDGEYVSSISLTFSALRFFKIKNRYFFVGGRTDPNLIQTDAKFNVLMGYFPKETWMKKLPHESFHKVADSLFLFQLNYKDTLYRINDGIISAYRAIGYGKKSVTYNELLSLGDTIDITLKFSNRRMTYRYYFESPSHIFLTFIENNKLYVTLFDKFSRKSLLFPYDSIINNISFEPNFPNIISLNDSGEFIAVIDPSTIISMIKKETKEPLNAGKEAVEMFKSRIDFKTELPNSNPSLLFFKFRRI
ncbi:MAG: hypothetical protein B6D37_12890 [Sphingobacteriales bacterium UTBCD1]|jgi:hypothetical protein|nr:MAG: hypothetical protein B6D37_12890 [Sphingobacteriales bacterium UTBCD1]